MGISVLYNPPSFLTKTSPLHFLSLISLSIFLFLPYFLEKFLLGRFNASSILLLLSSFVFMSPVVSEILLSGFIINSALRRRTHLVQSFSVVFLYWFYNFS
ncbi:hypothetical protein IC582_017036 [Cucumis melo]